MSTKTTYKRIALVAVAALGFGLLSVVPSSATTQGDTLTLTSVTTAGTLNVPATATLTQGFLGTNSDTMTVTASMVTYPTGSVAVPVLTASVSANVNALSTSVIGLVGTMMDTGTTGVYHNASVVYNLTFTPTLAGTYVMKFTPATNPTTQGATAAAVTWTLTVAAAATSSAATSTSILAAGVAAAGSADVVVNVAKAVSSTPAATIYVTPLTSTGSSITVPETLSVEVSGPGTAGISTAANTPSVGKSFTSGSAGRYVVSVWADGTAGVSTITIKSGTVTLGSETVTFIGDAASAVATLVTPVITSGSGATPIAAVTAIAKDSGGNVVSGVTLYAVSGTTTVFASTSATTNSVGKATFSFTGLVAGTSTVTIQNVAAGSTAGFSAAAVSVRAGDQNASSVTMTLDKATYTPGEVATITVVIKDAAGNTVPDGVNYAAFAAAVTSDRALAVTNLPAALLTTGSSTGTLTYIINVPNTSGDFTLSAKGGAGLAAAQAGIAISAKATVGLSATEAAAAAAIAAAANIAAAAVDAAAEATDAANAATDAANAAAEAADAATAAAQDASDAVAALSVQVSELVAGLSAQITAQKSAIRALTNLVIKIQKALAAKKK